MNWKYCWFSAVVVVQLLFVQAAVAANGGTHVPIVIQSDADFANCACVVSGSGSQANPYVIGPWSINNAANNGVYIDGSSVTKSFTLYNLTIAGNSMPTAQGIVLNHINPSGAQNILVQVYGGQTSIQTNGIGILVENSNYVTLDGAGANSKGTGVTPGKGVINKNSVGAVDVENSSHVTVRGWQMSTNGADNDPDYVAWDPSLAHWGVGGVRFFGVTNSVIDHNSANNDTTISFSLFNSSFNQITGNNANYPFTHNILITDGSSYNTVSGNNTVTGDFFGIMVADPLPGTATLQTYGASHDNIISNNISHSNGPTGTEIAAGIVPSFLGGIVLLNGTYNNQILNNQLWASTGGDLVWAQEVLNPSTLIGVDTYTPAISCNVTVSEGGGGVANLNGNVWKGNTFLNIDPCLPAQ